MHIADRCAPRKIADGAENLILQALQCVQLRNRKTYSYVPALQWASSGSLGKGQA
jgi:hypothetical protein